MPSKMYLGDEKYLVRLSSGKEIELTSDELKEINAEAVREIKEEVLDSLASYDSTHEEALKSLREIEDELEMDFEGATDIIKAVKYFRSHDMEDLYEIVYYTIKDLK